MLTIGFDAKRAFNNSTGLGNYSREVIRMLSAFYPDSRYLLYTPKQKAEYARQFSNMENVVVKTPGSFWKPFHSAWRSYRLAKLAAKEADIYHGLSHELPVSIEKYKVKTVVTMHDLIVWRHPELFRLPDRKIYQKKQAYACRIADMVIAISQQTKQDLVEILGVDPQRIRVVYQPCHSMFYREVSVEEKKECAGKYKLPELFILSVGTIEARKNLMTALHALQFIPKDIYLVAVGRKTEYADDVIAEASRLNLSHRLLIIDNADFTDFPAIYSNALAFVYPSFYEGFGIPILEAMNCGVPVITSNVTSLPEVGGDAALYITPGDYRQLATHVNNILADNTLREEMIRKGRTQADKFSEEKTAAALWGVYQEVLRL